VSEVLLQFTFKNFKSFRDDAVLDLTATKISEYNSHVISAGHEKVLPIAAIFGANASGKSNALEAFQYMAAYVIGSFAYGGDERAKDGKSGFLAPTPFLFDADSKNHESSFEVHFIDSEESGAKSYNYGFTVGKIGINEEWLNYRPKSSRGDYKRIFYRNENKNVIDLPGIAQINRENVEMALEKEALIVSLGAKLRIANLKFIRDWFLSHAFADFGEPIQSFFLSRQLPYGFADSKDVQENVVRYFAAFDPSIIGFEVESFELGDDKKSQRLRINAIHKIMNSSETASIPLESESAGTLKMFALYPFLQDVLESGGALFVDELNARLHPLLVRAFIVTFLDPEINANHAQLVYTSHDAWQLTGNMLRRDEVWFTEKSDGGASTLYSLAEFMDAGGVKIRKDENFAKNYLLGKYGAIPALERLDMFREE
jgi:AAA15 family ATPase/GTPase